MTQAPRPEGETSYDRIEYTAGSFPRLNPARLGAAGYLFGLTPAPASRCRMLELGCGQGFTLLSLAQLYPDSEFQGVDLSIRHIENAQRLASEAGLTNVSFEHRSITDISAERDGSYDYITSHGVYSWVPEAVKEKILEISGSQLTPQGMAYVSYNTLPGWAHLRVIREMLIYHTQRYEDPLEKHAQARILVSFLKESAPGGKEGWLAKWLQSVEEVLSRSEPSYFLHEYLEETNDPCFFHQFMEKADAHGLQYVSEADISQTFPTNLGSQAGKVIEMLKRSLVDAEQYMDFARNTQFRCTLLCRKDAPFQRAFQSERLSQLLFALMLKPVNAAVNLAPNEPEPFMFSNGSKFTSQDTLVKAALYVLARRPATFMSLPGLRAEARQFLSDHNSSVEAADRPDALTTLNKLFGKFITVGIVETSTPDLGQFAPERKRPEKPFALPIARAQAAAKTPVLRNTLHSAKAAEAILALLPSCDGTKSTDELFDLYKSLIANHTLMPPVPQQADEAPNLRTAFDEVMEAIVRGNFLWKSLAAPQQA